MFIGVFFIAVGFGILLDPTKPDNPVFLIVVTGAAALAGGIYWFRGVSGSERRLRYQYQEKQILGVAARHGGSATLAQISLETELDAAEATEVIDRLCASGIARADLLDDGTVTYRFGGLLPGEGVEGSW